MADRYWVGGAGTWNTTSTTNWSASTGGASGASVPTVADNVFFDQAGTYTVTTTGALTCLNITVSAGTVTFASGGATMTVAGSMSLLAGTVWNVGGVLTFSSTTTGRTVTTNGVTISASTTIFNGVGGGWTLGSALTVASSQGITVTAGSFDTGNYNVTCGPFTISGASTRSVTLGSSTISIGNGNTGATWIATTVTGLTFSAGTSTITTAQSTFTFTGGGLTYNNLSITSGGSAKTITGANTFNNLTVAAPGGAGVTPVTFDSQQTINGTLSTTGTAGNRRVFFASATYGISQDLVVNSAPSLTDADFRGLYVRGTSAPISGTRIGNRGECRNITFDTPKTVYWNLAGTQNWSANGWCAASGGTPSTDYFPLPQDTAVFDNAGSITTITLNATIGYVSSVDFSTRTNAVTVSFSASTVIYGSWTNGSGVTISGPNDVSFQGGGTQIITSAGKTFSNPVFIYTFGGTVKLGDDYSSTNQWSLVTGTFDTDGKSLTIYSLDVSTASSLPRAVYLRNSTISIDSIQSSSGLSNLTFDAGTSNISMVTGSYALLPFYDVTVTGNTGQALGALSGSFRNLTFTTDGGFGVFIASSTGVTVTGTLSIVGVSAISRCALHSQTVGTQITVSAATVSALTDVDFQDVAFSSPVSGTRLGDCGGNSNITFPAPKTVYWNLAGAQSWYAAGWATTSGGAPATNNFPLPQDTGVFDNAGSVTGTITLPYGGLIGTLDASARTTAMTLAIQASLYASVYGDFKLGTGVTTSGASSYLQFIGRGTQTITSNGRTMLWAVQIAKGVFAGPPVTQLADSLIVSNTAGLSQTGGFNAVTYNVTLTNFNSSGPLRMGTGTWTITGTGTVWAAATSTITVGTANIVLSSTSTVARTFQGGSLSYNRLTIGGATGISTTTITGNNSFTQLASTKTVAHTIALGTTTQTFGSWTVTGTVGNVVTLTGTGTAHVIAGPAVTGINYLAMGSIGFSTTSPGEFYAGVNSTGTAAAPVFRTAAPAARTLYWVGGTGNWSDTARWSTSSGGAPGAAIPTSLDAVNFDSASNATAYTATVSGVTLARCAAFTMAGPAAGNVTFAGTVGIAFHGNVSFAATGITRTYTGAMQWAGNASYTFTTNGLALSSNATVIGVGSTWTLGSPVDMGGNFFTVTYGTFTTSASNYSFTTAGFNSSNTNVRSVLLNGSTILLSGSGNGALTISNTTNLTWTSGSSQITLSASGAGISSGGVTFNNVSFTNTANASAPITGANTFNNLSFTGRTTVGINAVTFSGNQTITGTLTVSAGTASAYRTFLASDTIGTTRTLTCAAVSATDVDFRDITIAGAAAPASGTRLGDAKGNSGITFPAAKTVYWALAGGNNWGNTGAGSWSATSGGAAANTEFPLAQDTAYIPFATPTSGQTITVNANYNIGTLEMSNRNGSALVTLATGTTTPAIYGNWINGTGTTLTGTGRMTFAGRTTQQITSAGKTFTQAFTINTPGGSVTLQDAFNSSGAGVTQLLAGTFDAASYNLTVVSFQSTGVLTRAVALGTGTWTLSIVDTTNNPWLYTGSNFTVTGTGTISLTGASTKSFVGGGANYSGITLNQGGAGTLTITGNNTFKTITNTYSATGATSISLGNTTQTLTNPWIATGEATRVLTLSGTSAASPATLVYTGAGFAASAVDYLTINNVRAYPLVDEWYAGVNSTNGGTLGWYFVAAGGTVYAATITETGTGTDSISAGFFYLGTVSELATSSDEFAAAASFRGVVSESGTGSDIISAQSALGAAILESATLADTNLARLIALATIAESATITDLIDSLKGYFVYILESAAASDAISARQTINLTISEAAAAADIVQAFFVAAAQVSELATGTDQISALRALAAAVVETATLTDSVSARAAFLGLLQETATAQDAVNAPGSTYNILMQELASAQEAITTTAVFPVSLADTATGTDANSAAFIPLATITESATITDAASALQAFAASISETSAAADSVLVAPSIFNAIAVASATAIDNFNPAGSIYNVTVPESATLSDSVIGAFLWNLINDSQNVTWSLVDAAQPATWAHVEASQSGDWNIIPITTDRYGPTWAASAAGGGTAILLNGQQTTDGYQQYMFYSNGAWTVPRLPVSGKFDSIQYINGQYFVYSADPSLPYSAKLLRSTDGLNWSVVTTLPTSAVDSRQVLGMFGNGSTIVIAYNNLTYISTDNCATWTASSALPGDLQGVVVGFAFGAGLYVMCDGRRVFTSANALTWTQAVSFTGPLWSGQRGSVSWSGSRFVVIARSPFSFNSPQIRTSTNGITWTTVSPPSPLSTQAVWAFWNGSQFVFATAGAGSTNAAFYAANSTLTTFTLLGYLPGRFYLPTIRASYLMGSINGQYIPPGYAIPFTGTFYTSPNLSTFNAINAAWPTNAWGVLDSSAGTSWDTIPEVR